MAFNQKYARDENIAPETQFKQDAKKKLKQTEVTKAVLCDTKKDLLKQYHYITKVRAETEQGLVNGSAVLRKLLIDYNSLLNLGKDFKDDFSDLYYRLKERFPPGVMPVKDSDLRKIRTIDDCGKKSLFEEITHLSALSPFQLATWAQS